MKNPDKSIEFEFIFMLNHQEYSNDNSNWGWYISHSYTFDSMISFCCFFFCALLHDFHVFFSFFEKRIIRCVHDVRELVQSNVIWARNALKIGAIGEQKENGEKKLRWFDKAMWYIFPLSHALCICWKGCEVHNHSKMMAGKCCRSVLFIYLFFL